MRMVAVLQNLRHCQAFPDRGAGVLRVIEQALIEGILLDRLLPAHGAWNHTRDCVNNGHGGYFAAGQHIVAKRELRIEFIENPIDETLIAATDKDQSVKTSQYSDQILIQL